MDDKDLGLLIKQNRELKGLSQEELATKLNVSKATISLYEAGIRRPTLDRIYELAKYLEIPTESLMDIKVPKENLDLALRAHGITGNDVELIKKYIELINKAKKAEIDGTQ